MAKQDIVAVQLALLYKQEQHAEQAQECVIWQNTAQELLHHAQQIHSNLYQTYAGQPQKNVIKLKLAQVQVHHAQQIYSNHTEHHAQ